MDIEKTLVRELKKCKLSHYQIAKYTGTEQASLCRFVKDGRTISLKTGEKLLRFFGYTLAKVQGMPKLPPPTKLGRPPKKKKGEPESQTD